MQNVKYSKVRSSGLIYSFVIQQKRHSKKPRGNHSNAGENMSFSIL